MYSSEDFEKFYFQYQTEALPHGESLQSFGYQKSISFANQLNVRLRHFKKNLIMPIRNVLVIDVKRYNLKLKQVIQTAGRRRMIMMEPMIRFARIRLIMFNRQRLKSLPGKTVICPIVLTVIKGWE